jgi:hypothetical protein
MTKEICGIILGFIAGWWVGFFVYWFNFPQLFEAQRSYTECIALGAPQQNCLEKFLLPKEGVK